MNIKRFFCPKSTHNEELIFVAAGPVITYVNQMLCGMFQNGIDTKVLRQSEPLLSIEAYGEHLQPPLLDKAINRLKVMAGLNPVSYPKPIEATIKMAIAGKGCKVLCRFDDSIDDRCKLRMEKDTI